MKRFGLVMVIMVLGLGTKVAAQDKVYLKSQEKPASGSITEETAKGILLGKTLLAADDIVEVEYELKPINVRLGQYRPALYAENPAINPAKGAKRDLAAALKDYEKALPQLDKDQKFPRRHLEFKQGWVRALIAQETGKQPDAAIVYLKDFKSKHPDSWQIGRTLRILASLQISLKAFDDAEETLKELSQADVPDDIKREAELDSAQIPLLAGKPALAMSKLQALVGKLPKDSKHQLRARIALAECLASTKSPEKAIPELRQIIKDTQDKGLKAAAYNTLGKSLFDAALAKSDDPNLLKEARWEFLWVDVVYNQDREEHSKALYYLWRIFSKLGEGDRAQECREQLLNDRQFAGLDYQKRAQRESKTP